MVLDDKKHILGGIGMEIEFTKSELEEILRLVNPEIKCKWSMYSLSELEQLESIVKKIKKALNTRD